MQSIEATTGSITFQKSETRKLYIRKHIQFAEIVILQDTIAVL